MNLYEIERCETAKKVFRGKWRGGGGLHCYIFHKITNDSNFVSACHDLVASLYHTFSKVKYEMGSIEFRMCLRTLNSKDNLNVKPNYTIYSGHCGQLESFNRFVKIAYPSKRPTFCCMFISYSFDYRLKEVYPYFPTIFPVKKFPITNGLGTFKSSECVICTENQPNILFCVCGHISICEKCNEKYNSSTCLICRMHNDILRKI